VAGNGLHRSYSPRQSRQATMVISLTSPACSPHCKRFRHEHV
jgi:hypothetical protein